MAERVFVMPDPGEGLEEGTIVAWLVAAGDAVELNQPLVEVETAKAAVEIPSPFAGTVVTLHGDEGSDIAVGAPLVTFDVEGDAAEPQVPPTDGPRATPPVRKLAKELAVDLAAVAGTGPGGRITEADVRAVAGEPDVDAPAPGAPSELSPTRRAIAANLERQAAIPQVTTFRTLDATALDAHRRALDLSPLPLVVAALGVVVPDHPLVNSAWRDDHIEARETVDVGIAVDTDHGLFVPVLRDAGRRGIGAIAAELDRLADAARTGSLAAEDRRATATIAVSNTGSYGSEAGTPILSPGTSVTLAIGVIAPRALVVDGEVAARPAATLSLTFDHRVLDGAAAGRFLTDLMAVLQSPERLRDLPR
ncbi:MAG TPA: dihydrolipoamide acetyltransferase family protein [Actinomycetota bacterium]|nr:dihydrolipoamide acetyltransferase family protein [Actinomycetota bacterium]